MVTFRIAEDDDEEGSPDTHLLSQSEINPSPGANVETSYV